MVRSSMFVAGVFAVSVANAAIPPTPSGTRKLSPAESAEMNRRMQSQMSVQPEIAIYERHELHRALQRGIERLEIKLKAPGLKPTERRSLEAQMKQHREALVKVEKELANPAPAGETKKAPSRKPSTTK